MKCIVCHGEDIQTAELNEEFKIGNDIIYVPLTALVCRACGERYYDRRTMRYLQEVEQELKQGKASLQEIGKVLAYT